MAVDGEGAESPTLLLLSEFNVGPPLPPSGTRRRWPPFLRPSEGCCKLTKLAAQSKRNSFFPTVCVNVSLIFFSFRGTRRNERGLEGILDGGIGRMNEYVYIGERERVRLEYDRF